MSTAQGWRVAVIGLGKIGLPLAAQFANQGAEVVGVDIDQGTVDTVNAGRVPFPGEADLADHLARLVPAGLLRATSSYEDAVGRADVVVVVVPLFVDGDGAPDFGWMDAATETLGQSLTADTVVVYETTLPVGTTRSRWKPMLEKISGLSEGSDFHLVFSPERVLTGRVFADLRKYPKLVGGLSAEGADIARRFYEAVLTFDDRPDLARANGVWDLGSAEAAEMAKLAETTYRDVNIALANQFAVFAESVGIDVHAVIEACNSQPYSQLHRPGISVGGHCIPVYPRLYLHNDPAATVVRAAREANSKMPAYAVDLLTDAHGPLDNAHVLVLGAAYRGGVKEVAFSGVFGVVEALEDRGAYVTVHDPLFSARELSSLELNPHVSGRSVDAAVLHTDHPQYATLTSADLPGATTLVDGRGILDASRFPGINIVSIGRAGVRSQAEHAPDRERVDTVTSVALPPE